MIRFNTSFATKFSRLVLTGALLAGTSTLLISCSSNKGDAWKKTTAILTPMPAEQAPSDLSVASVEQMPMDPQQQQVLANRNTVKVAILLPLSGQHDKLGQSMLNAAQLALFDIGFDQFELLPKDTQGDPQIAQNMAREAIQEGAKLVLGPVFSASVKAAQKETSRANINMIAFSTDWTLANDDTYLIGFLPFDQIRRVTEFAALAGYQKIGVLSPDDSYGDAALTTYQMSAQNSLIDTVRIERLPSHGEGITAQMRAFARYDARKAAYDALPEAEKNNRTRKAEIYRENLPYDAVFMPMGGTLARQVGSFLSHYDLPPRDVRRLGTGLMDDENLASDRTLDGAWFAGPSPTAREHFEKRYKSIYGEPPQRISSLAYDATALATTLARIGIRDNDAPSFEDRAIINPNGFYGADGIFRFRRGGISERGLAILEYKNGRIDVVEEAPKTFQRTTYRAQAERAY